jgi:hypothetical protein
MLGDQRLPAPRADRWQVCSGAFCQAFLATCARFLIPTSVPSLSHTASHTGARCRCVSSVPALLRCVSSVPQRGRSTCRSECHRLPLQVRSIACNASRMDRYYATPGLSSPTQPVYKDMAHSTLLLTRLVEVCRAVAFEHRST